ncbi:DNA-binding transcriptional LysR family regulator OS=Ureibacillus acetophenoni OX=614649 GN=SAMN05877842_11632 PE=3 SV=1 [Ureibacillus acetophenoni]
MPTLMAHIPEKYPNMKFTLTQSASYNLLKGLEEGNIDLCLYEKIQSKIMDIQWVELWSEELFVIVPNTHRFASRESIKLKEIKDENFISIKRGNALRKIVDEFLEKAGITANTTFAGEEMHTVAGFVGAGLGVSLIPDIKGLNGSNVTKIRVTDPICERKIGVSWAQRSLFITPLANTNRLKIFNFSGVYIQ